MKYSCGDCELKGCCLQPVELVKEDIDRFKEHNIDVPLVYSDIGVVFVMIDSFQDDKIICPMLNDDGTCSIYEHRPNICRTFNCKALDMEVDVFNDYVKKCKESEFIDLLQSPGKDSKKELKNDICLEDLKGLKYEVIHPMDIMKKTVNTRYSLMVFLGMSEDDAMNEIMKGVTND